VLYLNAADLAKAVNYKDLMSAIEKAYALEIAGVYNMPNRIHLEHRGNTLLYMPCFLESVFGTKVLSLFPGNPQLGLPVISGLVMLNNAENGLPIALMDGAAITAFRTGAVGAVAIRHTAKPDSATVGLIGSGVQGYFQVLFACQAREIKKAIIFDLDSAKAIDLGQRLRKDLSQLEIVTANTVEELLVESEIVITATPATNPVLPDNEEHLRDKSYIAIGSYKPEMRELPHSLYNLIENVLIDTEHGIEESGDLITPLEKDWVKTNQIIKFGEYLDQGPRLRKTGETTLFKSVGMALFDIVVAESIYHQALREGIGTNLI
jgi:ornithine cyclodeaminase/alanine dehydrogenase-like protein (mu-crystallin family)